MSVYPMTGSGWVEKAGFVYVGDRTYEADTQALAKPMGLAEKVDGSAKRRSATFGTGGTKRFCGGR